MVCVAYYLIMARRIIMFDCTISHCEHIFKVALQLADFVDVGCTGCISDCMNSISSRIVLPASAKKCAYFTFSRRCVRQQVKRRNFALV